MEKIIVTGGGGFIGSSLIVRLQHHYRIVSIDHGRNYPFLKKLVGPTVTLVRADMNARRVLARHMRGAYAVVHLGGFAGESRCMRDIPASCEANVLSTMNLLDIASSCKVKKFIFSSSYWAYSTFKKRRMPLRETDPLYTDTLYGSQKRLSEALIEACGIPYDIFRLATVYGYGSGFGSQWSGIAGRFIVQASEGVPLRVYGSGAQKLDIIHIDDVVDVFLAALRGQALMNKTFNLGSGVPISVRALADMIQCFYSRHIGKKVRVQNLPAPPGKVWPDKWISIERLTKYVKDFPKTSVESGVLDMLLRYEGTL